MVDKLLLDGACSDTIGQQMRRAILFVSVLVLGRHSVSAQSTILADASTESPGAESGVSGAPSIAPKATPTVGFTPLTASERLRLYLTTTYGPLSIVHSAAARNPTLVGSSKS